MNCPYCNSQMPDMHTRILSANNFCCSPECGLRMEGYRAAFKARNPRKKVANWKRVIQGVGASVVEPSCLHTWFEQPGIFIPLMEIQDGRSVQNAYSVKICRKCRTERPDKLIDSHPVRDQPVRVQFGDPLVGRGFKLTPSWVAR